MEIRKSLEVNFLTCRHCQQPYRRPKALNCLHTFCETCLEDILVTRSENLANESHKRDQVEADTTMTNYRRKWTSRLNYGKGYESQYSANSPSNRNMISCPVCQKDTQLPAGGITDLPTDQLADKLASMVGRMPNFPVCDVCTKQPFLNDPVMEQKMSSSASTSHKQSQFVPKNRFSKPCDGQSSGDDSDRYEDSSRSGVRPSSNEQRQRQPQQKSVQRSAANSVSRFGDSGEGPRRASAACLECSKRMCSVCRDAHSKMPVTADHIMIRVERMDELRCDRHPRELRRFFCLTCRRRICVVCTFDPALILSDFGDKDGEGSQLMSSGHADHEVLSIREAISAYQTELSRKSTTAQVHINQIEALLSSLRACENEMRHLYRAIDEGASYFIQLVNREKRVLQNEIDEIAGVPLEKLSEECSRLSRVANGWYEFINDDRVTSRLDLMDPIDALTEGGPMIDRVSHCLELTSEPLHEELVQQPFMRHLQVAELTVRQADSGVVSSQSSSPPSSGEYSSKDTTYNSLNSDCTSIHGQDKESLEHGDPRALYWRSRLGTFQLGELQLGRIVTTRQLAAETQAAASKWVSTAVQTGPELVKSLPPPKGAQRHRAIQVNLLETSKTEQAIQTDYQHVTLTRQARVETGTQYCSADVNPPVSMYRSLKQLLVQK